jgi:hypothetical protein
LNAAVEVAPTLRKEASMSDLEHRDPVTGEAATLSSEDLWYYALDGFMPCMMRRPGFSGMPGVVSGLLGYGVPDWLIEEAYRKATDGRMAPGPLTPESWTPPTWEWLLAAMYETFPSHKYWKTHPLPAPVLAMQREKFEAGL